MTGQVERRSSKILDSERLKVVLVSFVRPCLGSSHGKCEKMDRQGSATGLQPFSEVVRKGVGLVLKISQGKSPSAYAFLKGSRTRD